MRGVVLGVIGAVAGCYQPTVSPGAPCSPTGTCPVGLACEDNRCVPPGSGTDGALPAGDAAVTIDVAPDACVTYAQQLDTCALGPGTSLDLIGNHTYDTGTHQLRTATDALVPVTTVMVTGPAGPIDVLVTESFSLANGSTLRVTGPVPFAIAARDTIMIGGMIDASAGGAGARSAASCGTSAGASAAAAPDGAGGGGGGGFRGAGGKGGAGDVNGATKPGADGGASRALPEGPLGGCPGGSGGDGSPSSAGTRGAAGGAIYLVSAVAISITGVLHAGGGGGGGGQRENGSGGGGGSGGMILLEAPVVSVSGTLAANGGGGGGGGTDDDTTGAIGVPGEAGTPGRADATAASGGRGGDPPEGGDGGAGGAGASVTGKQPTSMPDNGGGGGGGGCGYVTIASPSPAVTGVTSPPVTPWP